VAIGGWFAWTRAEPVYHGKPISYWIEPWRHEGETEASVKAAFDDMDDRAVEWLIQGLKWKPSMLAGWINETSWRWDYEFPERPDRRRRAAIALSELGESAMPAIPVLEEMVVDPVDPNHRSADAAARAALVRIRREPVEHLFRELDEGPIKGRGFTAALAMAFLPEHARTTVPGLASRLALTNTLQMRFVAAAALELMASHPEKCVTELTECLQSPEEVAQGFCLRALAAFGPEASSAVDAVGRLTSSAQSSVRRNATNALKRIQHGPAKVPFSDFKGLEPD
jgi:hypothetical protein